MNAITAIRLFVYKHMGLLDHAEYTTVWAICKRSQIKAKPDNVDMRVFLNKFKMLFLLLYLLVITNEPTLKIIIN